MKTQRIRHQLFLAKPHSDRLEALAARPGTSKSAILADALKFWLDRRFAGELEDHLGIRMDRTLLILGRIERDCHVLLETLALFVRYELAIHAPLSPGDEAGRAVARERFNAFVAQVGRQMASGKRTFGKEADQ